MSQKFKTPTKMTMKWFLQKKEQRAEKDEDSPEKKKKNLHKCNHF